MNIIGYILNFLEDVKNSNAGGIACGMILTIPFGLLLGLLLLLIF